MLDTLNWSPIGKCRVQLQSVGAAMEATVADSFGSTHENTGTEPIFLLAS